MSTYLLGLRANWDAADRRDQADDLPRLATRLGLTFDADGWRYPCIRDAEGHMVCVRCADNRWRGPEFDDSRSWAHAAEALAVLAPVRE